MGSSAVQADRAGADDLPVVEGLPDPFLMEDGSRVATRGQWSQRREEIKALLEYYEYGHMPPAPGSLRSEEVSSAAALDGAATGKRVILHIGPDHEVHVQVGLYIPRGGSGPYPVILAVEPVWIEPLKPVARRVIQRGYIFAGFEKHDLDADNADRSDGVHPLYPGYDWATIAVWAWGCMRVVDHLRTLDCVDEGRIALTGHSRAGKTALLAGAFDERIALIAPHASGAGGAGSYRIQGKGAESLAAITSPDRFHYWFHPRLAEFAGKEDRLPFDQHFLRALVAPRAVLSVEGLDDLWANPSGTQEMYRAAQTAFDYLGAPRNNAFYFRPGGHDMTDEDWAALLDFADHVFFRKPARPDFYGLPFPDAPKSFSWVVPQD